MTLPYCGNRKRSHTEAVIEYIICYIYHDLFHTNDGTDTNILVTEGNVYWLVARFITHIR